MSWQVNSIVFETEAEARAFSRDLQAYGGLGGWTKVDKPVTHYYLGDLWTEPIANKSGLSKEIKEV